jgi:hypothetical protein
MAMSMRDRRVQFGIAAGLVLLLFAFLLMRLTGGGEEAVLPSPSVPSTITPPPSPSPTPSPTFLQFTGRDPFQDLFGSQPGTSPPTSFPTGFPTTTVPTTVPTTFPTTVPTTIPTTVPSTGTPPPGDGGDQGSGADIGGHSVLLDDIFEAQGGVRKAQVEVDGTVYTVAAGERFDDNFELVSFPSRSCAHFVFGDEGFTLCEAGGK